LAVSDARFDPRLASPPLLATRDIGRFVIGNKTLEQPAARGRRLTGLEEAKVLMR
jgi:hypothetical protein